MDLHAVLTRLANRHPLFRSEADFQHELAWELRHVGLARAIRLERPFDLGDRRLNVDLVADTDAGRVGVELKYCSRRCESDLDGEHFLPRDQGPQEITR